MRVAYQGEPGAYGEDAALGFFGAGEVEPLCLPTFSAVAAAVAGAQAAAAVLPLENSIAGTVGEAVDALIRSRLTVVGELLLPIRHRLLALPGVRLADVRRVASHRQALAQCESFLARGGWQLAVSDDTAGAARQLAEAGDRHAAVIAGERAAATYGLTTLAVDIADTPANLTRFVVVARNPAGLPAARGPLAPQPGAPSTCLVTFETRHVAGALHHALGALAEAGVNLTRIESRPTGRAQWQYRFLVAVEGHHRRPPLAPALAQLRTRAHAVRVLGSFATIEPAAAPRA